MEAKTPDYRFDFKNSDDWIAHLKEKGFAVVGGVISQQDCDRIVLEMKSCLKKFSPQLTDEKSWTVGKNYPFMLHGGMVQYVGHAKFQWELREKAAPVFAKFWNCKETELATSFDGFCYMDGKRRYRAQDPLSFVHTDQSPKRDLCWSIQGLVNLCDNGDNDGGLILIPDSHNAHKALFKKLGKEDHPGDWYKFSDEEKKDPIFSKHLKINGKAGDVFLWDSRTLHCNTVPTSQNTRACVYVCQIPKVHVPEKTKKKRESAWMSRRCTNHHPGDGLEVFPVVPRYGDPTIKEIAPTVAIGDDELTTLQKSLLFTS